MYDAGGLEILTERECRDLLSTAPIGRIVFTDRALPAIQPVNFVISRGEVIIRTASGSKLAAAARGAVVAFEADDFDATARTGWAVVIVGHARVVADDGELTHLRRLTVPAWNPDDSDFIAIVPELISGRRIPEKTPEEPPAGQ